MNKTVLSLALITTVSAFGMETPPQSPRVTTPMSSPGPRQVTPTKAKDERDQARKRKLDFKRNPANNRPKTKKNAR